MAGDVRVVVMSLSARHPDGADADYIAWHSLDHLPEQYGIPSIVHGQRWVSTPACRAARAASDDALNAADHVVQYLFADPVDAALDRFFALGAELRNAGRMPIALPPVELGAYVLRERIAAPRSLVAGEVLPWRPNRGGYIIVSEDPVDISALTTIDGVAGVWSYEGAALHERMADTSGRQLTVAYLDHDPAVVGAAITRSVRAPVLLAAPFVTPTPFDWSASLP